VVEQGAEDDGLDKEPVLRKLLAAIAVIAVGLAVLANWLNRQWRGY